MFFCGLNRRDTIFLFTRFGIRRKQSIKPVHYYKLKTLKQIVNTNAAAYLPLNVCVIAFVTSF